MSDGKKEKALTEFKGITGANDERAQFYLESSNWNLNSALTNYLDESEPESGNASAASVQMHSFAAAVASQRAARATKKPAKKPAPEPLSNVRTLSSMQNEHDQQESSEEEDGQAFYAGGSEHSGQQVLGPSRRRPDIVTDVFRSVRQFGAEVVESQPSHSRGSGSRGAFSGTGYRLGETENDSEAITPIENEPNSDQTQVSVTLRFWKDGFTVNDGPLRPFDDPENADFLHHIKHGEIPNELVAQAHGREISFNMEDFRHAQYVHKGPKVASFAGTGQMLGSVAPTVTSPTTASSQSDSEVQPNPVEVDASKPTTNIQIRLADGSRLVGSFNHSHTIGDIRRFIDASSPQSRGRNYNLLSSFPRKVLAKNEETIAESGLINSVVMQNFAE